MLIHANWGLGEALVSGQAEGDEYRLREDATTLSWRLAASRIGAKRQASRPLADGQGTGLRPTRDDEARAATLTPAQAEALGAIARDAARALDYSAQGHDLEWAWDGQRFWILQARPITAAARHAYDGLRGQPSYWSRGNTREVLPHAVSALEWEALRVMCLRVLNRGFELAGYRPRPGVALARLFHGRVYLDASTIQWLAYDALGVAPALTNSMLGGPQPAIAAPAVGRTRKWLHGWRILTYSRRAILFGWPPIPGCHDRPRAPRLGRGSPARGHRGAGPTAARAIHRAAVRRRPVLPARLGRRHPVETAGTGRGGLPWPEPRADRRAHGWRRAQRDGRPELRADGSGRAGARRCGGAGLAARTRPARLGLARRAAARQPVSPRLRGLPGALRPSRRLRKPICVIRAGAKRRIICWTAC